MFEKARLEAFSDGIIAVILTIMTLDVKLPETAGSEWADLSSGDPTQHNTNLDLIASITAAIKSQSCSAHASPHSDADLGNH